MNDTYILWRSIWNQIFNPIIQFFKQFKSFVTDNLNNELPFVIDLTKIDFLDSSGLGALVQTSKECKKSKLGFSVVGNSRVAQTIKLVRLGDFLNLKSSLEDALNYLKN